MQTLSGAKQKLYISDSGREGAVGGVSLVTGWKHVHALSRGWELLSGGKVVLVLPDFCLFK